MKALGIDCGTNMGWAVGETPWRLIGCGLIRTKPGRFESQGFRFLSAERELKKLIETHKPDLVAFEELRAHSGVQAAQVLGTYMAIVMKVAEECNIPYCGLPVGAIKKHATGNHAASKELMIKAARLLWPQATIPTSDVADALHIMRLGLHKIS